MNPSKEFDFYQELSMNELRDINGGAGFAILAGIVIAAASQIIIDWDNFKNGLIGRPEVSQRFIVNLSRS